MPADGQCGSPLLAIGQMPPANSLPLALSQAGPSSGLTLPFICALLTHVQNIIPC
jgi:hypothetical protein